MIPGLQERIHQLEMGAGARLIKALVALLAFLTLAITWNLAQFRHFANPEAMDAAQLARNVAGGRGYTTDVIRPLDVHLLDQHGGEGMPRAHPDLSNAPAWPTVLAQLMRRLPMHWQTGDAREFTRYQPEVVIGWFNQFLFLLVLVVVFALARRLFDETVAWVSVIVLGGSELFWRFSLSGLSTMLLTLVCLLLFWCLAAAERGAREGRWGWGRLLPLALLAGVLTGVAGLTRYSFAFLALPVVLFFGFAFEQRRLALGLMALLGFTAVLTPWLARNHALSGHLFGTAGYALHMDSERFPGDRLERALQPRQLDTPLDIGKAGLGEHWRKFLRNGARQMKEDLPRLGGSWLTAFFLAGLLMPFQNPGLRRLRTFLLLALGTLFVVQALGRSHLSEAVPEVNSENLLVVLAPLVFVFGAAMFAVLLDQMEIEHPPTRNLAAGLACLVLCAPLIFTLFTPRYTTLAYPPYHPVVIQEAAGWMQAEPEPELAMSDIPWAVAWYGNRPCVWLTWDLADAETINRQQALRALYLTHLTLDRKLVTGQIRDTEPWGKFALDVLLRGEVPDGFPLREAYADWFPDQLFLTDRPRWEQGSN
jgi:4-amino-4-deoxy-L-arabinose transferase-like glycosyltransferase